MDLFAFPPLAALLDAAYAGLVGLVTLLEPLAGAPSAALAVALVTVLVRTALIPVGVSQAKAEQLRARLAPRLREVQRRYSRDPERLRRETMRLYEAENASPLAGCLPVLAQAPIVALLYSVFLRAQIADHPNALLAHELLGVPLGTTLVGALWSGTVTPTLLIPFGILLAVIVAAAEVSRRVFRVAPDPASPLGGPGAQRALGSLHHLTAIFAIFVPLAAVIYLTITTVWTLVQRILLRRRYPLPPAA